VWNILAHAFAICKVRSVTADDVARICSSIFVSLAIIRAIARARLALAILPTRVSTPVEIQEITSSTNVGPSAQTFENVLHCLIDIIVAGILTQGLGARRIATDTAELIHVQIERRPIARRAGGALAGVCLVHFVALLHGHRKDYRMFLGTATVIRTSVVDLRRLVLAGVVVSLDAAAVAIAAAHTQDVRDAPSSATAATTWTSAAHVTPTAVAAIAMHPALITLPPSRLLRASVCAVWCRVAAGHRRETRLHGEEQILAEREMQKRQRSEANHDAWSGLHTQNKERA